MLWPSQSRNLYKCCYCRATLKYYIGVYVYFVQTSEHNVNVKLKITSNSCTNKKINTCVHVQVYECICLYVCVYVFGYVILLKENSSLLV